MERKVERKPEEDNNMADLDSDGFINEAVLRKNQGAYPQPDWHGKGPNEERDIDE